MQWGGNYEVETYGHVFLKRCPELSQALTPPVMHLLDSSEPSHARNVLLQHLYDFSSFNKDLEVRDIEVQWTNKVCRQLRNMRVGKSKNITRIELESLTKVYRETACDESYIFSGKPKLLIKKIKEYVSREDDMVKGQSDEKSATNHAPEPLQEPVKNHRSRQYSPVTVEMIVSIMKALEENGVDLLHPPAREDLKKKLLPKIYESGDFSAELATIQMKFVQRTKTSQVDGGVYYHWYTTAEKIKNGDTEQFWKMFCPLLEKLFVVRKSSKKNN